MRVPCCCVRHAVTIAGEGDAAVVRLAAVRSDYVLPSAGERQQRIGAELIVIAEAS